MMKPSETVVKLIRKTKRRLFRRQAMAVCFRETEQGLELLLVSKRSNRSGLTFPKGNVELGELPSDAAAREAFEEAGVIGTIGRCQAGVFYYWKKGRLPYIRVDVFNLRVDAVLDEFPEAHLRDRKWINAAEAGSVLSKDVWDIVAARNIAV